MADPMKVGAVPQRASSSAEAPPHHAASGALLTPEQLAEVLTWKRRTIIRQAAAGRIPSYRAGRAYRFKLEEVLEVLRHRPAPDAMDQEIDQRFSRLRMGMRPHKKGA